MTGKQIYRLAIDSPAAKACIPMNFEPTVPLLSWKDGWIAEFWYYFANVADSAIYKPQYYLALEIPGGNPIKMERADDGICCLGVAPELFENEYYNKQKSYLEKCAELIKKQELSEKDISDLQELWLGCLPELLKDILKDKLSLPYSSTYGQDKPVYQPENLMEVLKQQMYKAIHSGDTNEIQRIQNEMNKLKR